jgi:hypothetical protein
MSRCSTPGNELESFDAERCADKLDSAGKFRRTKNITYIEADARRRRRRPRPARSILPAASAVWRMQSPSASWLLQNAKNARVNLW